MLPVAIRTTARQNSETELRLVYIEMYPELSGVKSGLVLFGK